MIAVFYNTVDDNIDFSIQKKVLLCASLAYSQTFGLDVGAKTAPFPCILTFIAAIY